MKVYNVHSPGILGFWKHKLCFRLYKESGAAGVLDVSIRACDGDGKPTGIDLAIATIDVGGIGADSPGDIKETGLSVGVNLTSGTYYALILKGDRITGVVNYRTSGYTNPYATGHICVSNEPGNQGVNWTKYSSLDGSFKTYSGNYDVVTYRRLVAIGNNQVWYESVG
jgi:hypothetical protein